MKQPQIQSISWGNGPLSFLKGLRDEKKPFCLYSGNNQRYSYIGANPLVEWYFYPDRLEKYSKNEKTVVHENPFEQIRQMIPFPAIKASPFFSSGWVGFLNYEMGAFADTAFPKRDLNSNTLLGWWGLYDPIFIFDHLKHEAFISSWGLDEEMSSSEKRALDRMEAFRRGDSMRSSNIFGKSNEGKNSDERDWVVPTVVSNAESNFTKEEYLSSVQRVLDYIHAGDCYQVNLSQQWSAKISEKINPTSLFCELSEKYPASYTAFINLGERQILSFSPEEFLSIHDHKIVTRPIKGTRKRVLKEEDDEKVIAELKSSEKDQSELLMIVDLERNDLGKVCEKGSIEVPHLKQVESLNYVHHLVATVQGTLRSEIHPADALRALFPGGSITGAPKKRGMEIIQELEPDPRGVYTGAIGFFDYSSLASFNIPIRTFEITDGKIRYGAGGGIVAESDPLKEYEETLAKAKMFLELFR